MPSSILPSSLEAGPVPKHACGSLHVEPATADDLAMILTITNRRPPFCSPSTSVWQSCHSRTLIPSWVLYLV